MPRAGYATVDDLPLSERAVLVTAHVRDCRNLAVVFEDGHALAADRANCCTFLWDAVDGTGIDESAGDGGRFCSIDLALLPRRCQVQTEHCCKPEAGGNYKHRTGF